MIYTSQELRDFCGLEVPFRCFYSGHFAYLLTCLTLPHLRLAAWMALFNSYRILKLFVILNWTEMQYSGQFAQFAKDMAILQS